MHATTTSSAPNFEINAVPPMSPRPIKRRRVEWPGLERAHNSSTALAPEESLLI
jgi:hypothetical protein